MSGNGDVNGSDRGPDRQKDELGNIEEYLGSSSEDYGSLPEHSGEGARGEAEEPKSPNNVCHDRFDARLYGELHGACEEIRNLEGREDAFETFPELLSDFFYSFYKAAPSLADEDSVDKKQGKANRPFVERLLEDDETRRTRINTRLDDMSAALAALAAGEKVLEEIEDRPELSEFVEQASSEDERPDEEQDDAEEGDSRTETPDPDEQEAPSQPDPDARQTAPSPPPAPPQAPPPRDLRRAIRAAAEAGAEDAEATEEALAGWGLDPADLASVPLGERIELARQLRNPRFKGQFDLVGSMRNLAHAKASEKVKSRSDEIHSIELSGDISRMLPSELAAGLASPSRERRLDFYRRFAEGQILSYELMADEKQAKGPIVAAIDCSASMSGHNMQWAIAVALALVDLASGGGANASDKRPAALVFFNESVKKTVRFAPGERDPYKLLEVATTGASGGTAYEPAIKQVFALCEESAHQGADVLLVTDGICRVPEEFSQWVREEKSRMNSSFYSVLIGSTQSGELQRYSEEVWTVTDLISAGDDTAAEIFERLG